MASQKTIEIVKSTAPVLKEHGEAITKVFYKLLFEKHPELKDVFNMTNQQKGTQQKVLANAIFQYATYIDKLEMLGDMVETIAQKHASLSIPKEAYPIVGENLLIAIQEVLGAAITSEIIEAWAEAYNDLAAVFINREETIYVEREERTGGFRGNKEFVVTRKEKESEVITSFYLERKDGSSVPNFLAGQYIALTVEIPGTNHKHTRNYSLSDTNDQKYLRISVKKESGDLEGIVSNFLHTDIKVGDSLMIGMPSGEFVLKENENPIVFISGGIGITPLLSMYKETIKNSEREIVFIQCAKNSKEQAFVKEINDLKRNNVTLATVYNEASESDILGKNHDYEGFLTKEILYDLNVSEESEFYFCGPTLFMANTLEILKELRVSKSNIYYEFFGPKEELELVY